MNSFGIALGPGALRGLAHIGVLQVLEVNGYKPSFVAGCSVGSVVGGLYAAGVKPKEMARMCGLMTDAKFYDRALKRRGLMSGDRLQRLIRTMTRDKLITDCKIPYAACAVDLECGQLHYIRQGPIHEAVRASCSIPGLFTPVDNGGRVLVDGGIMIGVPGALCRQLGAPKVIGVDVAVRGHATKMRNAFEIGIRSLMLMQFEMYRQMDHGVDLMITPDVEDCFALKWAHTEECIERGRIAAEAALPEIARLLG
ncbi:MAG: patatin-like phospholipase family protein [Clostridia bacterium]|nr:patatin-like phospholipase family protein [Clostridia bacterium]